MQDLLVREEHGETLSKDELYKINFAKACPRGLIFFVGD
jgi:hypothetical protein